MGYILCSYIPWNLLLENLWIVLIWWDGSTRNKSQMWMLTSCWIALALEIFLFICITNFVKERVIEWLQWSVTSECTVSLFIFRNIIFLLKDCRWINTMLCFKAVLNCASIDKHLTNFSYNCHVKTSSDLFKYSYQKDIDAFDMLTFNKRMSDLNFRAYLWLLLFFLQP